MAVAPRASVPEQGPASAGFVEEALRGRAALGAAPGVLAGGDGEDGGGGYARVGGG